MLPREELQGREVARFDRARRDALDRVSAGEVLLCRDLAALGVEGAQDHDPYLQRLDDERHCGCWVDPPLTREAGAFFAPAEYETQDCLDMQRWLTLSGVKLALCCGCRGRAADWPEIERAVDAALREEKKTND